MKFFLVFVFVCLATTGAYAQFHWGLTMDFNSDAFRVVRPTGDAATQYFMFEGNPNRVPNIGAANRLPPNIFLAEGPAGALPGSFTSGSTAIFGHQGTDGWTHYNQLRMLLNGDGEHVTWRARINMDALVSPGSQMVTGSGRPTGLQQLIFTQVIDQWWVRGTAGMFSAWAGIDDHGRGATDEGRFQDFSDITRGVNIEDFGIMLPMGLNPNLFRDGSDHNNFVRAWELTGVHTNTIHLTVPVIVAAARFEETLPFPFSIELALDPGRNSGLAGNPRNAITVNSGIRLSGENVFDMFNFDIIYQLRGNDPNTLENVVIGDDGNPLPPFDQNQPDGSGLFVHSLGAYVYFNQPLPNLGVSVGYSALFRTFEDNATFWADGAWQTRTVTSPLFSGIDLRLRYTGISNLTITLNNNVSFARASAGSWDPIADRLTVEARGLDGAVMVTTNEQLQSQTWLGFYNALAVNYAVNNQFSLQLQVANRFGRTTDDRAFRTPAAGQILSIERTAHNFSAALLASYQFNWFVLIEAGLSTRIHNNTWERSIYGNPAETSLDTRNSWSSGSFGFSLPIRMRLTF